MLNLKQLVKTILATILFITSIAAYQTRSLNNQVTLVEATPPLYPPIANAARVEGEVTVEVMINDDGNVSESKTIAGHKLLQKAAEVAALHWKFSALKDQGNVRKVLLSFKFTLLPLKAGIEELQPVFRPPFQVEIKDKPSHWQ